MKQKYRYRVMAIVATSAAVIATFLVAPYYGYGYGDSYGYIPPSIPPTPPTPPLNWWFIGGISAAVIIGGLLAYFLWWRRRVIA